MNDAEFMSLMAAHRARLQKIEERVAREQKDCVPLLRAWLIALAPGTATPEEKAQIASCPHGSGMVERLR